MTVEISYILPALIKQPPKPLKDEELLKWAQQLQAELLEYSRQVGDRVENMVVAGITTDFFDSDSLPPVGGGGVLQPIFRSLGSRRMFFDQSSGELFLETNEGTGPTRVAGWTPIDVDRGIDNYITGAEYLDIIFTRPFSDRPVVHLTAEEIDGHKDGILCWIEEMTTFVGADGTLYFGCRVRVVDLTMSKYPNAAKIHWRAVEQHHQIDAP